MINQFVVMFYKSKIISFKGIYILNPSRGRLLWDNGFLFLNFHGRLGCFEKIYGKGPKEIDDSVVEEYLKFESSSKSFKSLPVKSFSSAVDGIILDVTVTRKKSSWQPNPLQAFHF